MRRKKTVTVICGQYVFLENSKESTKGILNEEFSRLNQLDTIKVNKDQQLTYKLIRNYGGKSNSL